MKNLLGPFSCGVTLIGSVIGGVYLCYKTLQYYFGGRLGLPFEQAQITNFEWFIIAITFLFFVIVSLHVSTILWLRLGSLFMSKQEVARIYLETTRTSTSTDYRFKKRLIERTLKIKLWT